MRTVKTFLEYGTILTILLILVGSFIETPILYAQGLSAQQLQDLQSGILYYDPDDENSGCSTQSSGSGVTTLTGGDHEQMAFNFFVGKGLSDTQAASIVGNLMTESHMDPTIIQSGGDTNDPSTLTLNTQGWGIAQWTPGDKVLQEAQQYGITTPIYDLATQLNIVWDELNGGSLIPNSPPTIKVLEQTTTTADGVLAVLEGFEEGPISPPLWPPGTTLQEYENGTDYSTRLSDAKEALKSYGGSANNSGTTVSSTSDCGSISTANCSSSSPSEEPATNSAEENLRQEIVCLAETELSLWKSQPGYGTPNFPYAANGFLKYSQGVYEEWCADFVSWIYNQVGDPFSNSDWQQTEVSEIMAIAKTPGSGFTYHQNLDYIPQPGDLTVWSFPGTEHGHINIFISSSGGISTYIGGDQYSGPNTVYGCPHGCISKTPPSPSSTSIVSADTLHGYWGSPSNQAIPDSGWVMAYISPN